MHKFAKNICYGYIEELVNTKIPKIIWLANPRWKRLCKIPLRFLSRKPRRLISELRVWSQTKLPMFARRNFIRKLYNNRLCYSDMLKKKRCEFRNWIRETKKYKRRCISNLQSTIKELAIFVVYHNINFKTSPVLADILKSLKVVTKSYNSSSYHHTQTIDIIYPLIQIKVQGNKSDKFH